MDRLDAMSVLVAVVEAGSLSAASRRLGTPLATVSRKVSELEEHLKSRLLNRSSRRMTLTDAGQSYVAACRRIIEEDRGDEGGIRPSRLPATRRGRGRPRVRGAAEPSRPVHHTVTTSPSDAHSSGTSLTCASISRLM